MTPAEFLMRERDKREVFDSILRLVPSNVEAPLDELPDEIRTQLERAGIDARDVLDSYSIVVQQIDWAKDSYARMVTSLPAEERAMLQPSDALIVGAVYDAEFNGYVKRCEPGFAVCISTGALMLISFSAELFSLNASLGFQAIAILGDYPVLGWQDRREYRAARARRYLRNRNILASLYPESVANELEFLFKTYAHLGVTGLPSCFKAINKQFGYMPMFPNEARFGHPLEAGSHLREHSLRFLLLHECGHILRGHFGKTPAHKDEFEADEKAFELGVRSAKTKYGILASLIGAWLVLAVARRVEAYGNGATRSSHPPAKERLEQLFNFIRTTDHLGCLTRRHALYLLEKLERRDALLAGASAEYREMAKDADSIKQFVDLCVFEQSDKKFLDQLPRWIVQFPPARFFSSLAAARIGYERRINDNADDYRAEEALKILMKIYDAAGNNPTSTLDLKLQNAYLAEARQSG
jgi:hypothetical protein